MAASKKIVVLVPDGTGVKNYLYSGVFTTGEASLVLLHNFDPDTVATLAQHVPFDVEMQLPSYTEKKREKFLRELIHLSRIRWNATQVKNPTIHVFSRHNARTLKQKAFYALVRTAARFVRSYTRILSLEARYAAMLRKNPFYHTIQDALRKQAPDLVFCTHQRALKAPAVFAAASDLGIPTATVIYSWDNIPKARLALRADRYLVWSPHMGQELQQFYPEIPAERIEVTGTPQFEFYKDASNILPKETFYARYGLDPDKKLICFSGDDVRTSPHDPKYLEDLAEALTVSGMATSTQLIFRRCPVDLSGRYDAVLKKYPNLIVPMPPLWHQRAIGWSAVYPDYEDVKLLVSLAYYADLVINVGSTMAFDFGMFGKPCAYINYDTVEDPNWSVNTIYKYQHFRSMPSPKAVFWLHDREQIASVVGTALEQPETAIREWFNTIVAYPDTASEQIRKALL
ncbi:UDP-glycosyltransferase [Altibacter sp.]|uniref:UDP-glycosyltransferase n=1 Tax=Altibacter sp. TaxID=2024823 RepID=UPI000C960710|nr:UDP-glycosyltransferase [Altibacter sp.]MAP54800.1 UDP-glycosyltransferase [Altibacter sp.]